MNVGAVCALALVLAAPAVHGLVVGSLSPFETAVRLLVALVAAMVAESVLRRLLAPAPVEEEAERTPPGGRDDATARRSRPATMRPAGTLPEPVAERLRGQEAEGDGS